MCRINHFFTKGRGRDGRDRGRAKAVTEPIEPVEHAPTASGGGGRGRGRAKAVTEPIEPVEPIEHTLTASGGGGLGRGHCRGRGKTNKPVESDVSTTIKDKAGHSGKSSPNVITVPDDDPIYDDPPDDSSASELPERSQFGRNDPFLLDCSAILDESNEDNYEMETAGVSTSKPAKVTFKKRSLSTNSAKNKRQRAEGRITSLLQLSESEDGKDNIYAHSESSDDDGDKDDDEDDEGRKTKVSISRGVKNVKKYKPKALNGMENIFEVCQWLITERQDILFMAYQMYNASNTSLDSPLVNMPTSPLTMKPAAVTLNDEKDLARLWHEEINSDAEEVICHSKRVLTDFRSKLNKKIDARVSEFKEKRIREELTTAPTRTEIEEFLSKEVVEQILDRYLKGTDKTKLKNCGTMEKLVLFVREAFKIHYTKYNIKDIKKLDRITIKCKVPSRSGKNIASKFSLE
ncbi:hypothetical protein RhiirC2_794902 [Rhizophagus irregularis]|uniref:Uncharacterized protein n=1 Tax=Rhizophagus irregularis TaxID=588596 RepID=A0A2N1MCL6_9GLOM|nr:hypothetical protein RhiirC2_794902 [Rhizophagus irregularis]